MPGSYWDYYDHHLPLSDRSLAEALLMCGFALERVDPRFLPATTRSRLPRWPWLVEAWLALRPLSSLVTGRRSWWWRDAHEPGADPDRAHHAPRAVVGRHG
jgi:hypothetical protein